ncbi:hypothetical protein JRI60_18335 [Archangium violaceum]|uniref:Ig-like domain-containing protein n=1 Tax=Archangium violaceum TaxID=83451 RepID=UPI00194EC9C8|nr:Ig-like domain-containing protein [Archangium violaceum]QRO00847.1 hypothetical protein JRI60_18335 [Archangium violaceum]
MRGATPLSAVLLRVMVLSLVTGCLDPEELDEQTPRVAQAPLVVSTASLANARSAHTVTVLANGKVLAVGGNATSGNKLASCELYDPATGLWSPTGSLNTARSAHTAVLLNDGTVLVTGGIGNTATLSSAERYDPATGTWSVLSSMANAVWKHTATRLRDGRVLVTGGCPSPYTAAAQLFDPATNTWSTTGSMALPRCAHRATLLDDGRVLITGGTYLYTSSHRAEIFNPATGVFTETQPASSDKSTHQATRLADGRVLLLTGESIGNEVYDPSSNSWSTAPAPLEQRFDQAAVLMGDGSTLVFGGESSSVERFSGDVWSIVGHTSGERKSPGVAVLQDGSVLLVGGSYTQWVQTSSTSWTGTPAPLATTERYRHTPSELAKFDGTLGVPKCATPQVECDSASLLRGRGSAVGPERASPNTIKGSCADGISGGYGNDESLQALRVRSSNGGVMQVGQKVIIQAAVVGSSNGASTDVLDIFHTADANAPSWQLVASLPLTPAKSGGRDLSTTFTLPAGSLQAIRGAFRRGGSELACTTGVYDDHDDLVFAVSPPPPDSIPPTVAFTAPTSGAVVGGTVTATATASDNQGVTRVEFLRGSLVMSTDTEAPYAYTMSTISGPVTLTARAYDAVGNVATASVSFTVDRTLPTVSMTAPAIGSTVSGTVTVSANATDNTAVAGVSFYANGTLIGTDTTAPFAVSWNTAGLTAGPQSLMAQAVDSAGNSANSATRTVYTGVGYDATLRTVSCASVGASCDSQSFFSGRWGYEPNEPNTLGGTCADGTSGVFHSDESLDRIRVFTQDGTNFRAGGVVTIEATVWARSTYTWNKLDLYYAADARNPTWVPLTTLTPTGSGVNRLTANYTLPAGSLQAIRGQFRYGNGSGPCTSGAYNDRDDLVFAVGP